MTYYATNCHELPTIVRTSACQYHHAFHKRRATNNVYVIAIGWLYVVTMIAAVSDSLLKGVIRFVFLGALPVGLLLWVKLMRYRARQAERAQADNGVNRTDVTRTPDSS